MSNRIASLLLTAATSLCSCVTEDTPDNIGLSAGDPLPQFSVTLNDGSTISPSSLRGNVAVIEFFNTGCRDCRDALPTLQRLYDWSLTLNDVTVTAIARDEDEASIAGYWLDNGLTVPFSPQNGRDVYNLFATAGIPRIYVIDRQGIISSSFGPENPPSFQTLKDVVERIRRASREPAISDYPISTR